MNPLSVHIAVDVMGGDFGSSVTLPAVEAVLTSHPSLRVQLFGRAATYNALHRQSLEKFSDRVRFTECSETVGMEEKPSAVLRHKQQSSLYQAIDCVKRGEAQACVSAGNTGALMAVGHLLLKTIPVIDRPAVCAEMPTTTGSCLMLDLGANVQASPQQLLEFAQMGSRLARILYKNSQPRVALLNMGEEEIKGSETIKEAAALLQKTTDLNYTGFVEGHHIYEGRADVVVCDGFTGNAVLKASEGVARLIRHRLEKSCSRNILRKIMVLLARPLLKDLQEQMNPSRYNGACFLGLSAVVVKSHGNSTVEGFTRAIELAYRQVEVNFNQVRE